LGVGAGGADEGFDFPIITIYLVYLCVLKNVPHERLDTPMRLTLSQAAKTASISKSYLSKLIRTGRISAERQPNGEYRIEPSELDRIEQIRPQKRPENTDDERPETSENTLWEREREILMALLQDRDRQIQDLREDRDAWRVQAERLLLTMPDKPKPRWWEVFSRERTAT
jgi:excisionase family DNA binding protein